MIGKVQKGCPRPSGITRLWLNTRAFFMQYSVYIIYSESWDKYYIGQTDDFESRLARHNSGGVKSTSYYRPWIPKCLIKKETRSDAVLWERKLKNLNRSVLNLLFKNIVD